MKIGVISDTHDQGDLIRQAVDTFNSEGVGLVVHCGDWVSPFILHFFQGLHAPLRGVFGNNDGDKFRHLLWSQRMSLSIEYEDRFLDFIVDDRRIAVFHGDYQGIIDALVKCGTYDVVLHGHTHQTVNSKVGNTLSLNPGSLMHESTENVRGASVAIYDTQEHSARHIHFEKQSIAPCK